MSRLTDALPSLAGPPLAVLTEIADSHRCFNPRVVYAADLADRTGYCRSACRQGLATLTAAGVAVKVNFGQGRPPAIRLYNGWPTSEDVLVRLPLGIVAQIHAKSNPTLFNDPMCPDVVGPSNDLTLDDLTHDGPQPLATQSALANAVFATVLRSVRNRIVAGNTISEVVETLDQCIGEYAA